MASPLYECPRFGQYCARRTVAPRACGQFTIMMITKCDKTLLTKNIEGTLQLKTDPDSIWKLHILNCPNGEPIAWMAQIWPILCAPHCGTSRVWPNHDYDDYRGWQNHVACQIAYEWMGCQAKCVQHIDICNCFFKTLSRFDFQNVTFSFIQIGTGGDKTCRQFGFLINLVLAIF